MKKIEMMVVAALVSAAIIAFGPLTSAFADSDYRNYTQVRLGMNGLTGDLDDDDYDSSSDLAFSYGRYLTPGLVIEAEMDIFGTENDGVPGSTAAAGSYTRDDRIGVIALLATLKGELPVGPLTFFGGGGGGVYLVALNSEITSAALGEFETNDNDTIFGAHLVTGATYNFTSRFYAGLQGLYRWTEDVEIEKTAATVPVRVDGDLEGYTLTFSAGYRF